MYNAAIQEISERDNTFCEQLPRIAVTSKENTHSKIKELFDMENK